MDTNNRSTHTNNKSAETMVGEKLRELRIRKGFSLRELAKRSGLNINTLSLVENAKSSPSVSTLQQLATALEVPIATFFESESTEKQVVFTPVNQRPSTAFGSTQMHNLGKDLAGNRVQPLLITIEPGMGSGDRMIVHTGHEFVYCLQGKIHYKIEQENYYLDKGDSLVFEAHLPHCWENIESETAQILLILYPSDEREEFGGRHFSPENLKKENFMKIAIITEDGKTISQHFGRAPYFLVLTIADGKIVEREMRDKMGHNQFHTQHHQSDQHEHEHGHGHGMGTGSHSKHQSMAETISDCTTVICGGMGMGAYESMRRLNIQPLVTDLKDIDAAARAYIEGKLINQTERLH